VQYPLPELQQVRAARGHLQRELQQALAPRLRDFLTSLLYDIFHENDLKLQMLAAQAASGILSEPQLVPILLQCCPGMSQQLLDERVTVELSKLSFLHHVHGADDGGHQQSVLPVRTRFTSLLRPVLELVAELISHEHTKGTSYRAVLELLTSYKATIETVMSATASRHVQAEELVDILNELQLTTLIMRLLAESNSGVLHGLHQLDTNGDLVAMGRIIRDRMQRLLDDMLVAVSRGTTGHEVRTVLGDSIKNLILKEPSASENREHAAVFNLEESGGIQYRQRQLTLKICCNVLRYFEAISSVSKGAQLKMDVQLFYRDQNPTPGAQATPHTHSGAPDMSRAKDLIKLAETFYNEAQEVATAESIIRSQGIQARFPLSEQLEKQKRCRDSLGALVMCIEMTLQVMLRLLENDDSLVDLVSSSLGSAGLQAMGATTHGDMRTNRKLHLIELRRHCEDFIDNCCQTTSYPAQSAPRLRGSHVTADCAPALNSDFLMNMRHQLNNYFESKDIRQRSVQDNLSKYEPRELPGRVVSALTN